MVNVEPLGRPALLARLLLGIGLSFFATFAAQGCEVEAAGGGTIFPLEVQPGKRFLVDAHGQPFFIQGDSPWSLIAQLSKEDAELYLKDRKSRGFNTLLVNLIEHRFATRAPANIYGDKPFLDEDFGTPNEAYFAHADWVLNRACQLGFLVLLAPSYAGYGGGTDGWYQAMVAVGPERLRDYGRFVGRRYSGLNNILWVQGGDYNTPNKDLVRAVAEGIREADPGALHTAHTAPETAALEYWPDEPWLAVNAVYTYGSVADATLHQYADGGDMPFFLFESAYEWEHDADEQRIRMQAYQAVLSGASGQLYGNNPMWHFDGPGLYPASTEWKQALDSPGARSMTILFDVMQSAKWWLLQPDVDGSLLVDGRGGEGARVAAARSQDRSFALLYLPTSKPIGVDLAQLSGPLVGARWRDPTNGQVHQVEGSPFPLGRQSFKPPRQNQAGFTDWLLELTSENQSSQSQ
ncbi:MAG: hypothetical protein ABS35_34850 [Kaistia sp. SCN 65-12]|nr:MAG: hypothetical protein ABS35_34850 [Kaistia sp. SCN 65-12]